MQHPTRKWMAALCSALLISAAAASPSDQAGHQAPAASQVGTSVRGQDVILARFDIPGPAEKLPQG